MIQIQIQLIDDIYNVPLIDNDPDFSSYDQPAKQALIAAYTSGDFSREDPELITETESPKPMAFYEKLIGVMGTCHLNDVYKAVLARFLDPSVDTSSLVGAVMVFNGALHHDWGKEYAKNAFADAYEILKGFLSPEQIVIVDDAILEFNMG
jgi:hypothetical protein